MKDIELNMMTEGRRAYYNSARARGRRYLTSPKQAQLNDKHAWLYLGRLIDMNFGKGDYLLSLTYDDRFLPATVEDAKKDFDRFIGKLKKLYKAHGIKCEYIMVMSYQSNKDGEPTRLHFHVVLRGGVNRDDVEALWRTPDKAGRCKPGEEWKRFGEHLGYSNCDNVQIDGNGLAAHCAYLAKQPREGIARRWYCSVGLKKPYTYAPRDDKYSMADLKEIAERNADAVDVGFWERQYPGWTVCDNREYAYTCVQSEFSGVSIRVKLRKLTEAELEERQREKEKRRHLKERVIGHGNACGGARTRVRARKE
ncbi:MAG: hypothetical protein IJY93_00090 [Clostridia bacterium]|nr:hypothetical protein [Clostridia bacterium]